MSPIRPAILSSALLARKGAAMPTGYTPLRPLASNANAGSRVAHIVPVAATRGGPSATNNGRVRVSVRLDRERHLKLNSPLKKALLTGFHSTAKHNATKAVSPSSETMRTI